MLTIRAFCFSVCLVHIRMLGNNQWYDNGSAPETVAWGCTQCKLGRRAK